MSVRITDLPEATELNGSELMPIVQNGVTRRTTLDFVNQAAPAALILQQTQQVLADTQQVLADTQQVKAETDQVLVNTEGVYNQTVMVQGQVEISIADWETQYLGAKSDPPTTDNEGNPLHNGALYWDTSLNAMFVWSGTSWTAFSSAVASVNGQIGEVVLDYADVGAANSGANDNITSMSGVTGDIGSAAGLQFNTLTPSATAVGKLAWNVEDSTLDLGMAGGVVQQIGQEMFYSVQNQTGFPINGGSVVRAIGTLNTSGRILVAPATADGVYPSHTFMGVATETIQDGDPGLVTFFGKVRDIDTTGAMYGETWVDGDILYAHPEAAGGLTKVKPQAPNNIVMVALVIKAAVSGTLFVRTAYGSNLRDDELVRLNGLADGDVLQYDADLGRFENRTLSGAGIEPLGAAADSMVAHLAALDPHPQYTTPAEAAAAAPVQSVAGRTGAVTLAIADVSGLQTELLKSDWIHSGRDFQNGTLITTAIDYSQWSGAPWVLEIKGNSYGAQFPFDIQCQGYIYGDTIINVGGYSNGSYITGIVAINVGGNLCFWFPRQQYWQGFAVRAYSALSGYAKNEAVSITDSSKPSGTKEVAITPHLAQSLHSANFTAYAPDLTGSGASGTWPIAVSGNAATATKLATARSISLAGDVTGSASFDGSGDVTIAATVADSSHNHTIANVDGLQSALDLKVGKDSSTGAAELPAGSTAQRPAGATGKLRFNTTLNQFEGHNGSDWGTVGGGATGAPGNYVFNLNDQNVTGDYTIPVGKNAVTAGPITVNAGVTVTVSDGVTWTVV